jgi:hypothetical protein
MEVKMSEPGLISYRLPEETIRAMARGDRDFVVQVTGEGRVSAVCKGCVEALEIVQAQGLVWFHCPKCDRVSFDPVANVQRDIQFAIRHGQPFVSELFYFRELPATLVSPFAAAEKSSPQ